MLSGNGREVCQKTYAMHLLLRRVNGKDDSSVSGVVPYGCDGMSRGCEDCCGQTEGGHLNHPDR
jgi:hypothetical protein